MPEARAAVLACKSVSDRPVWVTFTCDENGRTLSGTDVLAALIVMQGMGVTAFGLNCVDPAVAEVSHINVNEGSVEGLRYRTKPILTVQFEPSDGNGYQDTAWVFDAFVRLLREKPMGTRG